MINTEKVKAKTEELKIYAEKIRKNLNNLNSISLVVILLVFICPFHYNKTGSLLVDFCVRAFGICFVGFIVFCLRKAKLNKYNNKIKKELLEPILSAFGDFHFSRQKPISYKQIKNFGLYHSSSKISWGETIEGNYNNVPISITECELSHKKLKRKGFFEFVYKKIIDFNGLILTIPLDKDINCTCVIDRKNKERAWADKDCPLPGVFVEDLVLEYEMEKQKNPADSGNNYLKVKFLDIYSGKELNKVFKSFQIDDGDFGRRFKAFSDNEDEARVLWSTSFIEAVQETLNIPRTLCEGIIFYGKHLYLFLNGASVKTWRTLSSNPLLESVPNEIYPLAFSTDMNYIFSLAEKIALA